LDINTGKVVSFLDFLTASFGGTMIFRTTAGKQEDQQNAINSTNPISNQTNGIANQSGAVLNLSKIKLLLIKQEQLLCWLI
jgi:hypothetical protein